LNCFLPRKHNIKILENGQAKKHGIDYDPKLKMSRSKPGRRKLPKSEKRSKSVQVLVKPEEREDMERVSAEKGQTLSDWARETLLLAIGRT
jgi:hypothetical protein